METLQESWSLLLLCGNVHTSAQLPLPENASCPQALVVLTGFWIRVCSLVGCSEVYGFVAWQCANYVLYFPLLRNVSSSSLQLPTARVPRLPRSLPDRLRAPPWLLRAACVDGSAEKSFVVGVFESRWAGGCFHDSFGPRRQWQGGEDAVIHG